MLYEKLIVKNDNLIILMDEEIDHHKTRDMRKKVDSVMDLQGIRNVVFDFSKTKFMDSSGIGLVMGRVRKASMCGGSVAVMGIKPDIDRILTMSGVYKHVTVVCDCTHM